jgi:hypothetical protein
MDVGNRVTRLEITEAVRGVFGAAGASRDEILDAARGTARTELVTVLEDLPVRRYQRLNQLWEELHDIPLGV